MLPKISWATAYYVDSSRISNGDGTAISTWKHWNNINWTTISSALSTDDVIVYFSSRDTWLSTGSYEVDASGNSLHTLTIDGISKYNLMDSGNANWQDEMDSTKRAKLQQSGGSGLLISSGKSYINVKGFYLDHPLLGGIALLTAR